MKNRWTSWPKRVRRLLPASSESGAKLSKRKRSIEQMGHFPALGLAGHVAIELPVDDLQLLAGERTAVLVRRPERRVVEKLLAPDVGADDREFAPLHAESPASFRCRGRSVLLPDADAPLVFMTTGWFLRRQDRERLGRHRLREQRLDLAPDDFAAVGVGGEIESERRDGLATAPDPAVAHEERGRDACQSAARRRSNGIAAAARTGLPCRNDVALARRCRIPQSRPFRFAGRDGKACAAGSRSIAACGGVPSRRRGVENRELASR